MDILYEFLQWVWARHHNIASWYVRPLFILPFCYFAYRRNVWGIVATLLLFPTTLFWFPAPARPDPQVLAYLEWERDFLTGDNIVAKIAFAAVVVAFLSALGAAFWKRNWLYGLLVLNAGTLAKPFGSVIFGGELGWAALVPSIVTLAVCNVAVLLAVHWMRNRRTQPQSMQNVL